MKEISSKREANKAIKKATFLDAAERLFTEKGFENTSVDEVTREAGLSKRTLYQYFQSKEDLFYAVALKGAQLLVAASEEAIHQGKNALETIRLINLAHLQFYMQHPGLFKVLNNQPANYENCMSSPHYQEIARIDTIRFSYLAEIVGAAEQDGSLNPALDKGRAVFFAFFAAFSLLYAFSSTGESVQKAMGFDETEFLRYSFDLIAGALK